MINRRGFLVGLSALIAAPAIVRTGLIMPVNAKLILPAKLEAVTFPIDGHGTGAVFQDVWKAITDAELFPYFPDDVSERWERLKKRNAAQFAQIWDQYGNPIPERTDA